MLLSVIYSHDPLPGDDQLAPDEVGGAGHDRDPAVFRHQSSRDPYHVVLVQCHRCVELVARDGLRHQDEGEVPLGIAVKPILAFALSSLVSFIHDLILHAKSIHLLL